MARYESKEKDKLLSALNKLYAIMVSLVTLEETAQKLTDALAFEFGFKAGVLSLIDKKTNTLKRVAVSHTEAGLIGLRMLPIPYHQIGIPLTNEHNLLVRAIKVKEPQITKSMYDLFVPSLEKELVDKLQSLMGITNSLVYPIFSKQEVIGTMIFSIGGNDKNLTNFQKEAITRVLKVVGLVIDRIYMYEELENVSKSLSTANKKLKELDQLKDDFVSIASHELRTPMTAIRSYAWLALNKPDVPLTAKLKKYLERTLISTERLINLVNDMLNISRIESGRVEIVPEPFDIIRFVDDVIEEVEAKASEKDLSVEVQKTPLPTVFADPDKVHQVLLNLVGNSLKFTPEKGKIVISFFSDGKTVDVSISDNGVGIEVDDMARLFTKFGRLDNSYVAAATSGGTGLGLYICKMLIEKMGGRIWARSEGKGRGACFTFTLPVASKEVLTHPEKFTVRAQGEAKPLEPVAI